MAVEVNKRKRKHKNEENEPDEADAAVPCKMAKNLKTPKKQEQQNQQDEQQHENDLNVAEPKLKTKKHKQKEATSELQDNAELHRENGNECVETADVQEDSGYEEKHIKFSTDFKMLNFRAKLRGTNFITELRHFLHLTDVRPKIIAKYIEKRGKPLELAEALERIDKTNVLHVAYICQSLELVVMEILSNQKSHMESAVAACRYFLKSHGTVIDLLLNSAQLKHRRIALKLLTAIVCVEPQLGRQLLSSYDILSNVQAMENFLSHSKFELQEEESVRKCFIHFVLAYLVDGNTLLIRNILDRGTLIRALASGLIYDDHVTVCVVLSTLRKYVLEGADITKTKKIHIFDYECCKHFVRLYDWHGPKVLAASFVGKNANRSGFMPPHEVDAIVDMQQRDAVAAAAHEFLLVLLTSRKFGITFDAMTHYRQKHNTIQGKVIGFLYKPWLNERKTDLILKMLVACPDLTRHTVRNFSGITNPMRTPENARVAAMDFLSKIITTSHPKLLVKAIDKMTLTDFSYWLKDICLPVETLFFLNGGKMLTHKNYDIRLASNRLLLAMFTQYVNYMSAITKREQLKRSHDSNSLRRFKFDVLNHILVNFPTVENILTSLYMSISMQNDDDAAVLAHLNITLDLVLIICKENRSFVNKTSTILDYLELLRPLYANDVVDTVAQYEQNQGNIKLELKAIKTILLLFPQALKPHEKRFSNVLKSFIKAFVHGNQEVQKEAAELLRNIFKNTGTFDACELEIDLWLEALRFIDTSDVHVVTEVFIEVLQVTKLEIETPKTAETVTSKENLLKLFDNIEKGLSVQAYIETLGISKLMSLIFKGVEIVQPLDKYLEIVCLLMYHYYPMPKQIIKLYEMEFKTLKSYMHSWLAADKIDYELADNNLVKAIPHLFELQAAILKGDSSFESIFAKTQHQNFANSYFGVEFHGKLQKFSIVLQNERLVMLYVQQIIFLVVQLVEKRKLQRGQAERAAAYLINLISIVRNLEESAEQQADDLEQSSSFVGKILHYIYSIRLSYIHSGELFNAAHESHLNYLYFLRELTEYCNDIQNFEKYAENYSLKLVKAVAISMQNVEQTKAQSDKLNEYIKLLKAFNLNAENCIEILNLMAAQLKYSDFLIAEQKSVYYELLVCVLQRLVSLQKAVECNAFIKKFVKLYTHFIKKAGAELNLELLEEAFYNFLCISHHYITQLDVKFFECMFVERKLNKSTIKLACLLLERDAKLQNICSQHLSMHIDKKELIYPLLKIMCQKQIVLDAALLQRLYQSYKNGFMKTIEKPQKAGAIYKENVECTTALIELCMPRSECLDFCNKNFKFDAVESYQMRLIHVIYKKALNSLNADAYKQKCNIFSNFINVQLQLLSIDLKKQYMDMEKLELFAYNLYTWWQQRPENVSPEIAVESIEGTLDFSKLLRSQQWQNFCKSCLKMGMQHQHDADTQSRDSDELNGLLLKLLAYLCEQLYADYDPASEEPADAALLFEMIFTHSKFCDILLGQNTLESVAASKVKTSLLYLLYTLAKKAPSCLQHTQIPIILGAYQAKLSEADRYALALLQLYELYDCGLQQYRPFIWGESAIAFYALRAADEERAKLTQQETSIAQVMSLVDKQLCEYTLDNFPTWRKLLTVQQMPVVDFANPALKCLTFGSNFLERRIESGCEKFDEVALRCCPKRDGIYEQCYDPAFFVPLMNMCFAPEAYAHPARPVQNGLLSLVFAALSSQDKDMRLAAGCLQLRYRAHFEQSKFYERALWIQMYENVQAGLSDLRDTWMKHKRNSGTPRVPYISCLFVAKTLNLTTDPTHLLYKQLTMYMRLKESFNFQCVPEFNVLFFSSEVEHQQFRQFIVEIIRNGIKSSSDLFLLVTTNIFKVLTAFYGSTMSSLDMNLLILSVFSTCVKIPASAKIMIEHVGILSWLSSIIGAIEFYQFDVIEGLISIINNLWYALKACEPEFHNFSYLMLELHHLILLLLPHLSARISLSAFAKLMNIMHKTVANQYVAMSTTQLFNLVDCVAKHLPTHATAIESIRIFGGAGAESHAEYCAYLTAQHVEPIAIMALDSLRSYVIGWWQCHNDLKASVTATADESLLNMSANTST